MLSVPYVTTSSARSPLIPILAVLSPYVIVTPVTVMPEMSARDTISVSSAEKSFPTEPQFSIDATILTFARYSPAARF